MKSDIFRRYFVSVLTNIVFAFYSGFTLCEGNPIKNYSFSSSLPESPSLERVGNKDFIVGFKIKTVRFSNIGGGFLQDCKAEKVETGGDLPKGLDIVVSADQQACEISGTPVAEQVAETYRISAYNSAGLGTQHIQIATIPQIPFVTTWKTDNPGASRDNTIRLVTSPEFEYDYDVDWGDGAIDNNVTGEVKHRYEIAGVYTVKITGKFPHFVFSSISPTGTIQDEFYPDGIIWEKVKYETDGLKLLSVDQWGNAPWLSMSKMFAGLVNIEFKAQDIPNTFELKDTSYLFSGGEFLEDGILWFWPIPVEKLPENIRNWDMSSVVDMRSMFSRSSFNQDISSWDISSVVDMRSMFSRSSFNQDISSWDVSSVVNMSSMFSGTPFNQDISSWDVSSVVNMGSMFSGTPFNQDISSWDISSVVDMSSMFSSSSFNQAISGWDVSSVVDMGYMFSSSYFNQDISSWDVSSVVSMFGMFSGSSFNQDISGWDVSSVLNMGTMFKEAISFDQEIGLWDVSSVSKMHEMFSGAVAFDQNIGSWDVSSVSTMREMFKNSKLSTANYDELLEGWSKLDLRKGVFFDGGESQYSEASLGEREVLSDTYGWRISDGGVVESLRGI